MTPETPSENALRQAKDHAKRARAILSAFEETLAPCVVSRYEFEKDRNRFVLHDDPRELPADLGPCVEDAIRAFQLVYNGSFLTDDGRDILAELRAGGLTLSYHRDRLVLEVPGGLASEPPPMPRVDTRYAVLVDLKEGPVELVRLLDRLANNIGWS